MAPENWLNNHDNVSNEHTRDNVLVIKRRELGWLVASILTLFLGAFFVGYFAGQRHAARLFVLQAQVDARADQQLLYAPQEELSPTISESDSSDMNVPTPIEANTKYQARVATFCSLKQASDLVNRAHKVGVGLHAHKIVQRGRDCYRISTFLYDTQKALQADLAKLQRVYKVPAGAIQAVFVNKKDAHGLGVSPHA